ncbi:bifunctional 2',3'-cyclic-nucleotide 2'-phosphodiesterase/3'-nucleotidase [Haliangium ochraceum]|uniref:5'-Nucleotidase domain protein n=1 Tax=Haliangium ochraceum (strain DSM 14365 / JCM 11303 / SMP-2) TaxID=502025 RepID=D0LZ34_HALO1|nr:bifunctional 2',3'-cyclic-nucleotide 2'-phosphodiesterase/3'-nucleotidase [Haliangium ochraceum]ACY14504.1 5'-Nucleotidase domain protein [Haliangium ochraceum DSM 14365]
MQGIFRPLPALTLAAIASLGAAACGDNLGEPDPDEPMPQPPAAPATIELRLLETTDLHMHLADYDYYQDAQNDTVGLANTASLIVTARAEVANSLLVDNGDLIQGNPLGDYIAREQGLADGAVHPVYKAMNLLDYDVGNIGNHEFNYGLPFLEDSLAGAAFPYISANVFDAADDSQPYFQPYIILDRSFVDTDGQSHELKVGFIGFVPPQIMIWDRSHLEGKVVAKDMVAMAERYVPEMQEAGADIIIAIPHSGINAQPAEGDDENAVYYLADVPGIDAILFGHSHRVFPSPDYEGVAEIDVAQGKVRGVPAVMAGYWGSHLGVIDLTLEQRDGIWNVIDSSSEARPISTREDGQVVSLVEPNADILAAISSEHQATLDWIRQPIGTITAPVHSFFARVQDDPSIQIVTDAQKAYVEQQIQGTELEGLPVLSAGAPFKAGFGSPENYTNVPAGTVSYRNMADLYIYPNTLKVVKLTGAEVREWLERSAGAFLQIDPSSDQAQPLLNDEFPSYNFDVIDGVSYEIDITQPSRYDREGELVAPDAHRIVNLMFEGAPIAEDAEFLVATNNYRAGGGGNFPGLSGDKIVIDAPDENRQVLANYIADSDQIDPRADANWRFKPIEGANANLTVTFETSPSARDFAAEFPLLERLSDTPNEDGYDVYRYQLAAEE